jgi:hypothetical protein
MNGFGIASREDVSVAAVTLPGRPRTTNHEPRTTNIERRSGQAIVEFVVGLVGLIMIVAFIIQVSRISREHTRALIDAREQAAHDAMADTYLLALPAPEFINDWRAGNDEREYSQDDRILRGDPSFVASDLLVHSRPQELQGWAPGNRISQLASERSPVDAFGLVHGHAEEDEVPLMPVIRHLLYNHDEIEVEADAWLVWTKGLY